MKLSRTFLSAFILSVCAVFVLGQAAADNKQFNKDGLTFDYPTSWMLQDSSTPDAQQLILGKAGSESQIRVFVFRTPVNTPERVTEAKKVLVDAYVNSTAKQFEEMGAKPERLPATTDIGGVKADGIKVQAVMDGETGAAEIYWGVAGERLVLLTYFGSDKARKQTAAAWDTVRNSVKVAGPVVAKPTPSPE